MRRRSAAGAALLLALLAGCGKEVVVGGYRHVDANGTGDGTPEGSPSRAPAGAPSLARLAAPDGPALATARAQGSIAFDARVSLVGSDGHAQALNASPATAVVRIDGADTVHVASADVPAGRYVAARVVFTRVVADVSGGLVIGGTSFTGLATVFVLPGDSIVVERSVDLTGSTTAGARLLIDLDASAWLPSVDRATRLVPTATFRDALKVRAY